MSESFAYNPGDHEREKASNSYLMSLIAVMVGLPLPIVNLAATFIFYLGNRKGTYFVRWHCTQALLGQFSLLFINVAGFTWTLRILFSDLEISNQWIAYMITLVLFNLTEFVATLVAAIQVRKGKHVQWWIFAPLTNFICKP